MNILKTYQNKHFGSQIAKSRYTLTEMKKKCSLIQIDS